jgi:hypothetical protein
MPGAWRRRTAWERGVPQWGLWGLRVGGAGQPKVDRWTIRAARRQGQLATRLVVHIVVLVRGFDRYWPA